MPFHATGLQATYRPERVHIRFVGAKIKVESEADQNERAVQRGRDTRFSDHAEMLQSQPVDQNGDGRNRGTALGP